jgi:hypothetical protein
MCDTNGGRASTVLYVRNSFTSIVSQHEFIKKAFGHMVNHKVQDFQDPLTNTLVLMATSPLQFVMCEAGLLLFRTNLLPVVPYGLLASGECNQLQEILARVPDDQLNETIESSGQYTLMIQPFTQNMGCSPTITYLCKKRLLHAFVEVMLSGSNHQVGRTLCNIVLQRFMAQVPTPSDIVNSIMAVLHPAALMNSNQSITTTNSDTRMDATRCDTHNMEPNNDDAEAQSTTDPNITVHNNNDLDNDEPPLKKQKRCEPRQKPKFLPAVYNI